MTSSQPHSATAAWESSKENVQPLARGRDPAKLNAVLAAHPPAPAADSDRRDSSEHTARRQWYEDRIAAAASDDPLADWVGYIRWLQDTFPAGDPSADGRFDVARVVERCCRAFVAEDKYRNDFRYVRVWIRFAASSKDPIEIFQYMEDNRIGDEATLYYEARALAHEHRRENATADKIYTQGIDRMARPIDRLHAKKRDFDARMMIRWKRSQRREHESHARRHPQQRQPHTAEAPANDENSNHQRPALGALRGRQAASSHRPTSLRPVGQPGPLGRQSQQQQPPPRSNGQSSAASQGPAAAGPFQIFADDQAEDPVRDAKTEPGVGRFPKQKNAAKENTAPITAWPEAAGVVQVPPKPPKSVPFDIHVDKENADDSKPAPNDTQSSHEKRKQDACSPFGEDVQPKKPVLDKDMDSLPIPKSVKETPLARKLAFSQPPSPTLNTKRALAEVDQMFDSTFPQERYDDDSIVLTVPQPQAQNFTIFQDNGNSGTENRENPASNNQQPRAPEPEQNADLEEKENQVGKRPLAALAPRDLSDPQVEASVLQPRPELEGKPGQVEYQEVDYVELETHKADDLKLPFSVLQGTRRLSTIPENPDEAVDTARAALSTTRIRDSPQQSHKDRAKDEQLQDPSQQTKTVDETADQLEQRQEAVEEKRPLQSSTETLHQRKEPSDVVDPFEDVVRCEIEETLWDWYEQSPNLFLDCRGTTLRKGVVFTVSHPDGDFIQVCVQKLLGEGRYAKVFLVEPVKASKPELMGSNEDEPCDLALKAQNPSCLWEYYVCRELSSRIPAALKPSVVEAIASFEDDRMTSFLLMRAGEKGTLHDLLNLYRVNGSESLDETLVIFFAIELLRIIEAIHSAGFLHTDIKPDNLLVRCDAQGTSLPPWVPDGQSGWGRIGLTLIDFGRSLDLGIYKSVLGASSFKGNHGADSFACPEMIEGKPWRFQADTYAVASTVHILLTGRDMDVEKKNGRYQPKTYLRRYWQRGLWEHFFDGLINLGTGSPEESVCAMQSARKNFEGYLVSNPDKAKELRGTVIRMGIMLREANPAEHTSNL